MNEPAPATAPPIGWFVATFAVYVVLGVAFKSVVLNWIIGPLWLVLTLFVVPNLVRAARERFAR